MRLFGRQPCARSEFHNLRTTPLVLWLEPWAEEFLIPVGSNLVLEVVGPGAGSPSEFEWRDTHLTFYGPGQTRVRVIVDGNLLPSGSSELECPGTPGGGTREFVTLAFGEIPGMRAGSADVGSALDRLGEPMAAGEVRLEPLCEEHRDTLKAACAEDLDIWSIYAWSWDPDHFDATFDRVMALANWRRFAIFSGRRLVGMSCFIGIDAERGVLEIGNTYYIPEMRGTGFNLRVKDLMIGRAIECGFRRIEFRVDARNVRSQAAMAKLGATREGVIRADRITWTGHVRDTVLFSILADEWPSR